MQAQEMNLSELTNKLTLALARYEAAVKRRNRQRAERAKLQRQAAALRSQLRASEATPPTEDKTDIARMISPAQKKALNGFAKLVKSYTGGQ